MKKIALAIENFSKHKGGAESYAVSLASTLVENGWETHLFGKNWDGEPSAAIFHRITIPKLLPSWAKMLLFALKHKKMVKNQAFDIILGFGNTLYMNVYQSHGGVHRFSTARKLYTVKNKILRSIKRLLIFFSLKDKMRNWIESAPFRLYPKPKIIAISLMIKEDFMSFYHLNHKEIEVIYNGIDTAKYNRGLKEHLRSSLRQQLGISDNDVAFLFISYDLKKKGIMPLIKAATKLKKLNFTRFKVVVVGERPNSLLLKQVKRLRLEDTIIFTGPTKTPEDYYANCDVFVLPTFYDACSLVVIEAMACGLPAITTTYNGVAGIITNEKDGYIISHPPHSEELAEAMKALMVHERLKNMSIEASITGKNYSLKKNHHEMLRVFNEMAE